MKIIHTADLHLDSKMNANFPLNKAVERRHELLKNFERMVEFSKENGVEAILIAGDLFDSDLVSNLALNFVEGQIRNNPEITFYVLKGNHDDKIISSQIKNKPDNLRLFNDEWTSYELSKSGRVKLYGAQFNEKEQFLEKSFILEDKDDINLVVLHGQISESGETGENDNINLRFFKNKGINYLALGHIHEYMKGRLDAEGIFVYPGCLEARGFDECSLHGFVLLDIDEEKKSIKDTFIPFSLRNFYEVNVDIEGALTSEDINFRIKEALKESGAEKKDIVRVKLSGFLFAESEKNPEYIKRTFRDEFYYFKLKDETKIKVNYEDYLYDKSLKGEFVRIVQASDLSEEMKGKVISKGLITLRGENT